MAIKTILKTIFTLAVMVLVFHSCTSVRNGKKGCDGHKKTRVPFGYM
ncbi:MAG: hypothetical protein HUU47_10785 [Bacteroidetes bacterium]|nr:hypothetical protein [Bacteroidota bacterium]